MVSREQDHQHTYVGTVSPDADGDTGDRSLPEPGGPTQAGGTADQPPAAADPGGQQP
jgi:hypothetical protein